MYHITEIHRDEALATHVFPSILSGNTILFLGAGASIAEDGKYLGKQLMEHHAAETGNSYVTDDIIHYVDVLSKSPHFHREKFDAIVEKCLRNLSPRPFHATIARLPWKEIITTNLDTVVEKAFDDLHDTSDQNRLLKPIRTIGDSNYTPSNDEVRYIKLNGCISDRTKFPFVFSTRDFESANGFYRRVLQSFEYMSPRIQFLVVGYSFGDPFAQHLLDRFDRYNPRSKRDIFLVDPHVQAGMLPYLKDNNIRIIQCTASDFFEQYEAWEAVSPPPRRGVNFRAPDSTPLKLSQRLLTKLGDNVRQIHPASRYDFLSPRNFYNGERPSFFAIERDYDVVRTTCQDRVIEGLLPLFGSEESVIPIVALTGSYGVGKTTFCYRLARTLLDSDLDVAIFEVLNPQEIRDVDLKDLLRALKTDNVLFIFDECEVDSFFKAMIALRAHLSIQVDGPNIVMLVPIRENILQKLTVDRAFPNLHQLHIDGTFSPDEATTLIRKLDDAKIIQPRDAGERSSLAASIVKEYGGDAFTSLLSIVTDGHHERILRSAYEQLSKPARDSFLFTSLLYRYKMLMPASLLMKLVSKNWNDFRRDVIEYDARGILVQEERTVAGDTPDLYFRTRHPAISERLVQIYLDDLDAKFRAYEKLISKITYSRYGSGLIIDLLRATIHAGEFSQAMINSLYDRCASEFYDDPHFNLHYAINLQHRGDRHSLELGISRILHVEGYLERRSHRLIHRRAFLNFRLASLLDREQAPRNTIAAYIKEARELFDVKLILDPDSLYSYREFLRFEIWHLEVFARSDEARMRGIMSIENLLDRSRVFLHEGRETIAEIEATYRSKHNVSPRQAEDYRDLMDRLYNDPDTRPYALILYYHHYSREGDARQLNRTLRELRELSHLAVVAKLLFRHYGQRLHQEQSVDRLFELAHSHGDQLRDQDPFQYHYYLAIAEAYSRRFQRFWDHMNQVRERFGTRFYIHAFWCDESGHPVVFDSVIQSYNGRLTARVIELQYSMSLSRRGRRKAPVRQGSREQVSIRFHAGGMTATIANLKE